MHVKTICNLFVVTISCWPRCMARKPTMQKSMDDIDFEDQVGESFILGINSLAIQKSCDHHVILFYEELDFNSLFISNGNRLVTNQNSYQL